MTPDAAARYRHPAMRWLLAHQGWYFFPLLLLEGLSLHVEAVKRVTSRGPVERRWVEAGFLAVRLKLPALVGYLVAGICIGPHSPGYVADAGLASQLAEIGVMLLMATVSAQRWRRWPRPVTEAELTSATGPERQDFTLTDWPPANPAERDPAPLNLGYPDPTPTEPLPRRPDNESPWSAPPRSPHRPEDTTGIR